MRIIKLRTIVAPAKKFCFVKECADGTAMQTFLLLAQLPPPVHGVSTITAKVAAVAADTGDFDVVHLWRGSASSVSDIGRRRWTKALAFAGLLVRTLARRIRFGRAHLAYTTLAPHGDAVLRDALLIAAARLSAKTVLVHLHTRGLEEILAGASPYRRLLRALISDTELVTPTQASADAAATSSVFRTVHRLDNFAPVPPVMTGGTKPPTTLCCAFMGHIDPRKGALRFVAAIRHLAAKGLPIAAKVAGASSRFMSAQEFQTEIEADAPLIEFQGFKSGAAKDAFLASTDLFIYLSRHDFAPLVLIEAMSHGAIPIAFDIGAVKDLLGPEFASHVIPADGTEDEWKARIAEITNDYVVDPARLERDREVARRRFMHTFTEAKFADQLRSILETHQSPAAATNSAWPSSRSLEA